jgi:hypothetical protein
LLKSLALFCKVNYAEILPIERNIDTGFHHWVLANRKLNQFLSNPGQFVSARKNVITVDLNLLSLTYQKKFIEPNTLAYIEAFIKQTEYILYNMMAVYKLNSFKATYHFQLGSIIYPREVFYFFVCKIC